MTEEIEEIPSGIMWDKPHFYLKSQIFMPKIYEPKELGESVPKQYNTVQIHLDGKVTADLDWKAADEAAQRYQEQGLQILWDLDLGLFKDLKYPLEHKSQFLSLLLSLEHFRDNLWKKYKEHTLGVCLFRGSAHFSQQLPWDDHLRNNYLAWGDKNLGESFIEADLHLKNLFARDAVAEYLMTMAQRMPDALQLFARLEIDSSMSLVMETQLTHRERFDRLHLMVTNSRLPTLFNDEEAFIGVCLPSYQLVDPKFYKGLESALEMLLNKKMPFKLIPENFLTSEWDGLDYLIVLPETISTLGQRKLQGFSAAGGTILELINDKEFSSSIILHAL